jgi:hypothetical protein
VDRVPGGLVEVEDACSWEDPGVVDRISMAISRSSSAANMASMAASFPMSASIAVASAPSSAIRSGYRLSSG